MTIRTACFWLGLLAASFARGEVWRTTSGDTWEGKLSGVDGPIAVFAEKGGSRQVVVGLLDDASLGRVADFLAARPPTRPWSESTSAMAKALRNRLQVLRGEKLATFELAGRPEPELYLVYFGALWCGPCVRFSPELLDTYEMLKLGAGDRFELVFVSNDRGSAEQLQYVRKVGMPWPVLKFSAVGSVSTIERWAGRGIPCLVALTPEGDVIFHSYRGEEYLGPKHVLQQTSELLRTTSLRGRAPHRGLHRLAVLQHVRAAAGGAAGPKPYIISMDPKRYRTLEAKELVATLELDAEGRVASAAFEPKLDAVVEYQLLEETQSWLFLPAVENGKPLVRRVQLPLKLGGG